MFGDISTDLAAAVHQGGMGMAPSGEIGMKKALFDPIHGTAPFFNGKNISNPIVAILSAKMKLNWIAQKRNDKNLDSTADLIESSVAFTLK